MVLNRRFWDLFAVKGEVGTQCSTYYICVVFLDSFRSLTILEYNKDHLLHGRVYEQGYAATVHIWI